MKQLGLSLALLFFACWFGQSSAQCACNDTACQTMAMQNNPTQQMCCNWITQPIDTDPNSLDESNGTPLGFLLDQYRGTDNSDQPNLCVRVNFPTPFRNIRYVVVAVESQSTICVQKRNPGPDDERTCGSGGVYFCQSYTSITSVDLEFFCGDGAGSCPPTDEDFFFRPTVTTLDTDDEFFCDNIDRTLPGSLVQDAPDLDVNANPMPGSRSGATFVISLLQPVLLLVTMLAILLFY